MNKQQNTQFHPEVKTHHWWPENGEQSPWGFYQFPNTDLRAFPGYVFPEPFKGMTFDNHDHQVELACVPYGSFQVVMVFDSAQSRHIVYVWDIHSGDNTWCMAWSASHYSLALEQAKRIHNLIRDSYCRNAAFTDEQLDEFEQHYCLGDSWDKEQVNSWLSFLGKEMLR